MKLFTYPQKVLIPPELIDLARDFAKKVVATVNYSDSNQSMIEKITDDHFVSKIGEEAVKSVFQKFGKSVIGPDYTIYDGKQKSWEEDLRIAGVPMAVKTQKKSAALKYGLSWTFQSSGFRDDPILNTPDAWVCLVESDDNNRYECRVFPPYRIKELIFKEPVLKRLKGKKKVIYARDLPR
jgi:hypothetical protein